MTKKKQTQGALDKIIRGTLLFGRESSHMGMRPPVDPTKVFEEMKALIDAGAVDMALALYLEDAAHRDRWHRMYIHHMARLTIEALTETQERRMLTFFAKKRAGKSDGQALDEMAAEEDVTPIAIRESLSEAGVELSTADRRGRRS